MQLTIERIPEKLGAVVRVESESLDAGNVDDFKAKIASILDEHRVVLVDMSSLGFVDSSGLGALLSCLRIMKNKNGELKLFAMTKPVQALFELVRMHRLFSIYNAREEAIGLL